MPTHAASRQHREGTSGTRQGGGLDEAPDVLTVQDLVRLLRIGRNQAYDLVNSGQIPCCRIGSSIRIAKAAVVTFIQSSSPAGRS